VPRVSRFPAQHHPIAKGVAPPHPWRGAFAKSLPGSGGEARARRGGGEGGQVPFSLVGRRVGLRHGQSVASGCRRDGVPRSKPGEFPLAALRREAHYEDFLGIVQETLDFVPMRILAYCQMPNHWHLALYPRADRILPSLSPHYFLDKA